MSGLTKAAAMAAPRPARRRLTVREDWSDEEHAAGQTSFGDGRLQELLTLVGYYRMLALRLRVWRVLPIPED